MQILRNSRSWPLHGRSLVKYLFLPPFFMTSAVTAPLALLTTGPRGRAPAPPLQIMKIADADDNDNDCPSEADADEQARMHCSPARTCCGVVLLATGVGLLLLASCSPEDSFTSRPAPPDVASMAKSGTMHADAALLAAQVAPTHPPMLPRPQAHALHSSAAPPSAGLVTISELISAPPVLLPSSPPPTLHPSPPAATTHSRLCFLQCAV